MDTPPPKAVCPFFLNTRNNFDTCAAGIPVLLMHCATPANCNGQDSTHRLWCWQPPPCPRRLDWSKVVEKDLARLDLTEYLDAFFALPPVQVASQWSTF